MENGLKVGYEHRGITKDGKSDYGFDVAAGKEEAVRVKCFM